MNRNPAPGHRWKPGQSGNPSGRPKGSGTPIAKLRKILEREAEIKGKKPGHGITVADQVAELIVRQALAGDFRFVQFLMDKLEAADLRDELDELRKLIDESKPNQA